jgi:hypothetical protein
MIESDPRPQWATCTGRPNPSASSGSLRLHPPDLDGALGLFDFAVL